MDLKKLKKEVCLQNKRLAELGLVILTEGNVSQISKDRKFMLIKPSGVSYANLTPEKIVKVEIKSGKYEGKLKPSSDTPTHLEIYRRFPHVKGIAHTHSPFATTFAQMGKVIPCLGTTHADAFYGPVPVTRILSDKEIRNDYELNTGKVIAEILASNKIGAVLVTKHAPFCFGISAEEAVDNSLILEKVAMMALTGPTSPIPKNLLHKHYERKHGKDSYYGQR